MELLFSLCQSEIILVQLNYWMCLGLVATQIKGASSTSSLHTLKSFLNPLICTSSPFVASIHMLNPCLPDVLPQIQEMFCPTSLALPLSAFRRHFNGSAEQRKRNTKTEHYETRDSFNRGKKQRISYIYTHANFFFPLVIYIQRILVAVF